MSAVIVNPPSIGDILPGDILVVDDTAANLELLANILGEAGYHTRLAAGGELALRIVEARQPLMILLDIKMPGMDGFEVCRRLKKNALTRDIPVIFLSGLADTSDKLKGFALGAVDYITKPFHNDEVLARVRIHLALSATQEQLTKQIRELQLTDEQLVRDNAEQKGIQENLEAALKRLQALNVQITKGQDEERHKIAYELHEQLGQEIVSLKLYLDMLKAHGRGKEVQARLLLAQGIATGMLHRIRNMSRNLRPPELDTLDILGLFAALQIYCRERADAAGWVLHFDAPRLERPPRDVEVACFRLVHDALAHIAQHAGATEVWLNLRISGDELQLDLRDNGAGFDAAGFHERMDDRSLALIGMEERVRQVGGSFEIKSSPGGGAEIHVVFPKPEPNDGPQ